MDNISNFNGSICSKPFLSLVTILKAIIISQIKGIHNSTVRFTILHSLPKTENI